MIIACLASMIFHYCVCLVYRESKLQGEMVELTERLWIQLLCICISDLTPSTGEIHHYNCVVHLLWLCNLFGGAAAEMCGST